MGLVTEMTDFMAVIVIAIGVFIGALSGYKLTLKIDNDADLFIVWAGAVGGMVTGGLSLLAIVAIAIYAPIVFVSIVLVGGVAYKLGKIRQANKIKAKAKRKAAEEAKFEKMYAHLL